MKEIDIPKTANGFIYTLKSIEKTTIACPKSCSYIEDKDYDCWYVRQLKRLGITFNKGSFDCIKVVINVKNTGNYSNWMVGQEDAVLVDSDGFAYNGIILCEDCLPPRVVRDQTRILPQTQVNYIQIFPIIDAASEVAKIKVNINHVWTDFLISESVNNPFDGKGVLTKETSPDTSVSGMPRCSNDAPGVSWQIQNFTDRVNRLKTSIYSRLNNVLTESEKIKLENKISNELYNIKIDLQSKAEAAFDAIRASIQETEIEYEKSLQFQNEKEENRKQLSQKLEELLELSPREFEEYIGELFTHLGYFVEVTQYSNDKGIDIIMTKDGIKYGVQCKRYKGTVGSPEIQKFIGALDHLKSDKGFFVTTGMFSFEAEKMAAQHPICLINRVELAKMILEALNH